MTEDRCAPAAGASGRPPGPPDARDPASFAAVLVDNDGTLVDSEAAVRRTWFAFAHRHGLEPEATVRAAQGRPAPETARALVPEVDVALEARRLEADEISDTDGVVALPGAEALLRAPLRLALVTSGSRRLAIARLRAADLPVPETIVAFDDVAAGKPSPEPYRLGAARLGVDPTDCLVIEDAPAGVLAGRAAGATVLALRTTHSDAELRGADAIVDDLSALRLPARDG